MKCPSLWEHQAYIQVADEGFRVWGGFSGEVSGAGLCQQQVHLQEADSKSLGKWGK